MIFGFRHCATACLPHWAGVLHFPYWRIRVEGRNASLRRSCYRAIEKEKLRLVEAGIPIEPVSYTHLFCVCFRSFSFPITDFLR